MNLRLTVLRYKAITSMSMMHDEVISMRKVIKLQTVQQDSKAAQVWMEHLINRLLLEELNLPIPLAAKTVHQLSKSNQK